MSVLRRIQDAIRAEEYELSVHAFEEAEDDDFLVVDIENAILNGAIVKKYTHDPRVHALCGSRSGARWAEAYRRVPFLRKDRAIDFDGL